jgi:hypothetical protein
MFFYLTSPMSVTMSMSQIRRGHHKWTDGDENCTAIIFFDDVDMHVEIDYYK